MKLFSILFLSLFATLSVNAQTLEINSSESEKQMKSEDLASIMGGEPAKVQDEYTFQNRFVILTESFNKKGKVTSSYEMVFFTAEKESLMGMQINQEGVQSELVYDLEKGEMITLMQTGGQKMGTTMKIDKAMVDAYQNESTPEKSEMPQFEKTGNTETISGYSCDEYIVSSTEAMKGGSAVYWITDETDADWVRSMGNMSSMNKKMPDLYADAGYPADGSVIRMILTDEKGEQVIMTVKEAETNGKFVINTGGYTFMNIGGR